MSTEPELAEAVSNPPLSAAESTLRNWALGASCDITEEAVLTVLAEYDRRRAALAAARSTQGAPTPGVVISCPHCLDGFTAEDIADGDVLVVCSMCTKAERGPASQGAPAPAEPTTAELLRAVAAGRREYANRCQGHPFAEDLEAEAATFESAAQIAGGDLRPLYGLLPSWRWTEAMDKLVQTNSGDSITLADVADLAAPPATEEPA